MRMELEVELQDSPGQLIGVLETVGRFGANVITVVHDRSRVRNARVPVLVALEVAEEAVNPMLEAVRGSFRVLRVQGGRDSFLDAFLLVGHVFQSDLSRVTEAVFSAGAEVRRVRAEIAGREHPSAVLVDVAAATAQAMANAREKVRTLSREKGFAFLHTVEAGA